MGCSWSFCAALVGASDDDGALIEYFPEELAPIARQICTNVRDAIEERFRRAPLNMWRTVTMHGHSSVESPQDLDGACSDRIS